jgi:signal peptidase II
MKHGSASLCEMPIMVFSLIILVDQASKWMAVRLLGRGEPLLPRSPVRIRGILNVTSGIGAYRSRAVVCMLWAVTIAGGAMMYQFLFTNDPSARVALCVAMAGVTSNSVDRVWRGGVIDYIDLRVWPVFNLADLSITCGVLLAVWQLLE